MGQTCSWSRMSLATCGCTAHHREAPGQQFAAEQVAHLLPAPEALYDVPIFVTPKVARDPHIELARGLYSVPAELVGQRVEVRADLRLVKVFSRGQLVKSHHRVKPGSPSTDPKDYPAGGARAG